MSLFFCFGVPFHSNEKAGTARLDGLDLGLAPWQAPEAGGELVAVEDLALARLDRAESGAGLAANGAAGEFTLVERAVLLGLLAVAGERVGQRLGGRSRVGVGSVVHVGRSSALAQEANQRLALSSEEAAGSEEHGCCGRGLAGCVVVEERGGEDRKERWQSRGRKCARAVDELSEQIG